MIELASHQQTRIAQLATHYGDTQSEILEAMSFELGEMPTQGQVTAWLWKELLRAGIEKPSGFQDSDEAIDAWQAIERGEGPQGALTIAQFRAIVECGIPRKSSVSLTWGDE